MIPRNRTLRLAAAGVVGAALTLSACGSSDDGGDGGGGDEASSCKTKEFPDVKGDGQLTIGTLLPETGSLAFLGPPEFAAVELAVKDMNKAGGVLGKPVKKVDGDSGDAQNPIASTTVDNLFSKNVDGIVGAASSAVSLLVIDKITNAGVVEVSPANTSDQFSSYCDNDLYFRTAPPDTLQGAVLADQIVADGNVTVGILALQDAYGTGLAEHVERNLGDANAEVVKSIVYDPKAANYASEVSEVAAEDPDAIVLIGFDETKKIIPELVKQGMGADQKHLYFVDGNLKDFSGDFKPGTLGPNAKGTLPGVAATDEFKKRLATVDPNLEDWSYAAESYDATILMGLAATAAETDAGPKFAKEMRNISREGTKCKTFAECVELLKKGEDIDYDGMSGPIDFLENGDPGAAYIGIYQYGPDNNYKFVEARQGEISEEDVQ